MMVAVDVSGNQVGVGVGRRDGERRSKQAERKEAATCEPQVEVN